MTRAVASAPPRFHLVPRGVSSKADDVFAMADLVGFELDPWQRLVVEGAFNVRHDGTWAAKEVGVNVPRQNGKGALLELLELTALFTWLPQLAGRGREALVIHSAHEWNTSQKHFDRVWSLVEGTPELLGRVPKGKAIRTHGQEGFRVDRHVAIEFRTRTKGGGRGFSADLLVLDEAMFLPESAMGALLPTLRSRPDPQIWYTGSAVDQDVHDEGLVWTRVRARALQDDPGLAYFEWSLPFDHPEEIPPAEFVDEHSMWASNPAFGIRIFREHFEMELKALDNRTAAVELYGVGDYPDPSGKKEQPIDPNRWVELAQPDSVLSGPVAFGFDVSPERRTSIAAAGRNQDGMWHVEVIEKLPGTAWLPAKMADLCARHLPHSVVTDSLGPGASMIPKIEELAVTVEQVNAAQHALACSRIVDAVTEGTLRHLGSMDLLNAIRASSTRPLGDRWLWSRRRSTADISPLVAATLALSAAMGQPDDFGGVVVY